MAAASSAISFLMSLAVPSTWYFQRTARAAKLKFPSSEGARTPGPVYRIAFCPRHHRGFRPGPTLTEGTDSFLAGCAVCCLRMWDQDHIWGRRLPPEVSGLQHFHKIVSPATFRPTECLIGHVWPKGDGWVTCARSGESRPPQPPGRSLACGDQSRRAACRDGGRASNPCCSGRAPSLTDEDFRLSAFC